MEENYERAYHSLEGIHWWFVARRDIIIKIIESLIKSHDKNIKILDIGCSGGQLLSSLYKKGFTNLWGIDISKNAIQHCIRKNLNNVYLMDCSELSFKNSEFDIIIASDVLEHVRDDEKAICEWQRVLKKDGFIICFVPAFPFLWSYHDIVNKHFRRYTSKNLSSLFNKNEFKIIRLSYWNILLFFL